MEREGLCVWGYHNSTFTRLSDLTALEGQCQWPSCKIPISWVCATVEMKRERCLYRAPGLSDYCPKTRGFACDKDWSAHRGSTRPQLFSLQPKELISSLPAWLNFFFPFLFSISIIFERAQRALLHSVVCFKINVTGSGSMTSSFLKHRIPVLTHTFTWKYSYLLSSGLKVRQKWTRYD